MGKNANFVSHKKSKLKENGGAPKLPLAADLVEGEIAVNFGKDVETLSIKNESGDVVTFSSDNYYTEKKLGSGFTKENSANTVTSVIETLVGSGFTSSSITDVIIENEEIISTALIDLDDRKLDASAYTPTDLSNYYKKSETSGATELSTAFDAVNASIEDLSGQSETVAVALNELNDNKLDASAYTPSVELWESGTGLNSVVLKGSSDTASGNYSVAEGLNTTASGNKSHAEGEGTKASGASSHAEGFNTKANGQSSHAEGSNSQANGDYSHAEGYQTSASGYSSHAEGIYTKANGGYSHAEGASTTANGQYSHAEGASTTANGQYSHAEGQSTTASGSHSHAEGYKTTASGYYSHAEGESTTASGSHSHAEGNWTTASGSSSHAEGGETVANGDYSHAEGYSTIANNQSEHASGQYNVSNSYTTTFGDSGNTLFSVGNGTYGNNHNAFEIRQNGDIYIVSGNSDIRLQDYLGGSSITVDQVIDSGTSASTNAVATKAVVNKLIEDEETWAISLNELNNKKFGYADFDSTNKNIKFYKDSDDASTGTPISSVDLSSFSIDIDQVLDDTTSASTNPVSSKAVYKALTDNELVWTNAYVAMSGAVSSHTENTEIHVTAADKTNWNAKVDASALSDYYTKSETSGATEISNALAEKSDSGHTHEASGITAMTGYQIASSSASVLTTDTLLEVIGKLEKRIALLEIALGGLSLVKISTADYENLNPKDPNTLYIFDD